MANTTSSVPGDSPSMPGDSLSASTALSAADTGTSGPALEAEGTDLAGAGGRATTRQLPTATALPVALPVLRPGGPGPRERWALRLVPPLVYLGLAAILYSHFLARPNDGVPGGPDGLLYCWYFKWTEYAVIHGHNPFITDWLNAPDGINAMWNTGVFGVTLLFLPITHFFGPIVAGGLAMMLSPVASATTCYFVLRAMTGVGWRAAIVSLLYGFGPFFVGQAGHLHLIIAMFPPLVLYFGRQLFITQQASVVRTGLWFGLVVGLQLIVGEEILVLAALCAVVGVLALAILHPRQISSKLRFSALGIAIAAAVSLVIAGVPLYYQFFGDNVLHGGVSASSQQLGLAGLVVPSYLQFFATDASRLLTSTQLHANGVENTGYLGWPLIAVVVITVGWLLMRRDRFVHWWLIIFTVTLVFSFGDKIEVQQGHTLSSWSVWETVRKAPLLQGIVPIRFTLITTLLIALLLCWALALLPRGRRAVIGVLVLVAVMVPLWPNARYRGFQNTVATPRFFTTSAVDRLPQGANVLLLPVSVKPSDGSRIMVWQMRANMRFKLVGGWGVFDAGEGKMTYNAALPPFLYFLNSVGRDGRQPQGTEFTAARRSIVGSQIQYIVITNQQHHSLQVKRAAAQLTGCTLESVADVTVCQIPPALLQPAAS